MPDRRFIGDFESLLRFVRRAFLEAVISKQPVLGGVGVTFGNIPQDIPIIEEFELIGLVCLPTSDDALDGWGFPYETGGGIPIDPPRGTAGGTHPEGYFDGSPGDYIRSSTWFDIFDSVPMSALCGGVDWTSSDGSIILSYGNLGSGRYQDDYGGIIYKRGSQIPLTPTPTGLVAAAADTTDNTIILARESGTDVTIWRYYMTDSTFTEQDTGTPAVILHNVDLQDLTDEDAGINPRFMKLQGMSFSPDASKGVLTTVWGDLVELSFSGLTVNVLEEYKIKHEVDDFYMPADLTDGRSVSTIFTGTCNAVEAPPGTWTMTVSSGGIIDKTTTIDVSMTKVAPKQFYIYADYDQSTGNRVELYYEVSGTRSATGTVVEATTSITDTIWNAAQSECGDPVIIHEKMRESAATPTEVSTTNISITKQTTEFKLGSTVLESFTGTATNNQNEASQLYVSISPPPATYIGHTVATGSQVQNHEIIEKIFAVDLRFGFVSYRKAEYTMTQTISLGVPAGDNGGFDIVQPDFDIYGEYDYKVIGGGLLPNETFNIPSAFIHTLPFVGGSTSADPWIAREVEFLRNQPTLHHGSEVINVPETSPGVAFTAYTPLNFSRMPRKQIEGNEINSQLEIKDLEGNRDRQIVYRAQNSMALATIDQTNDGNAIVNTYSEFTHGDAVALTETTGTNPKVKPLGVA